MNFLIHIQTLNEIIIKMAKHFSAKHGASHFSNPNLEHKGSPLPSLPLYIFDQIRKTKFFSSGDFT